jgi:hypothetical protein
VARQDDFRADVLEIKSKLCDMHDELKRFMEHSNRQHLESILEDCRSGYSEAIVGYVSEDVEDGLEGRMVEGCQMRENCKVLFSDLLQKNIGQIRDGKMLQEAAAGRRKKLLDMKSRAPKEECSTCFQEASRLLDKQIDLMRSLKVYRESGEVKEDISALPEETVVKEVLEPLSNKKRLQILKSLSSETRTFSALAGLTGLRGGNLLFHLQKLLDCNMIMQRSERGDYMITEKGFKALRGVANIYSSLVPQAESACSGQARDMLDSRIIQD